MLTGHAPLGKRLRAVLLAIATLPDPDEAGLGAPLTSPRVASMHDSHTTGRLMPQLVSELDLPHLDMMGLERREALDAVEAARSEHWLARTDLGYAVTRLQDVTAILRDQRFHSALSIIEQSPELESSGFPEGRTESILTMEGEGHARLRRLVAPAFTPASANRLRPTMRAVVGELVDRIAGRGECELVADVCEPYPIPIICELLGAPPRTGSSSPPGPPTSSASSTTTSPRTCRSSCGQVRN